MPLKEVYFLPESTEKMSQKEEEEWKKKYYDHCQTGN
jgi:hypothetical protein